ncbi:MAG: hypothetical protein IPJ74_09090 [Saprospiraceae bacterium]|nr:hypothetical protein [Saprospiraceae bacterium]
MLSSKYNEVNFSQLFADGKITCHISSLPILPGNYTIDACCKTAGDIEDYIQDVLSIEVISGKFPGYRRFPSSSAGPFLVENYWTIN